MLRWVRKRWKELLTALVCLEIYVGVAGCANTFILHPSTDRRDPHDAVARKITVGNQTIEVWTAKSPACAGGEAKASLIEFCGNGTRAEDVCSWIANVRWKKWPVEVWCMNYPGFGGSTGPATLASIPPAALATYDAFHAAAPDRPIFLESNSLGGTSVAYVASKRPVAGAVLTNPPPLRRLLLQRYGWWNLWLLATPVAMQVPVDMNTPDTAPFAMAPACFLLSDEDSLIPPYYHNIVVNAYGGPKHVIHIPGVGHNSPLTPGSEAALGEWIDQQWLATFKAAPSTMK